MSCCLVKESFWNINCLSTLVRLSGGRAKCRQPVHTHNIFVFICSCDLVRLSTGWQCVTAIHIAVSCRRLHSSHNMHWILTTVWWQTLNRTYLKRRWKLIGAISGTGNSDRDWSTTCWVLTNWHKNLWDGWCKPNDVITKIYLLS